MTTPSFTIKETSYNSITINIDKQLAPNSTIYCHAIGKSDGGTIGSDGDNKITNLSPNTLYVINVLFDDVKNQYGKPVYVLTPWKVQQNDTINISAESWNNILDDIESEGYSIDNKHRATSKGLITAEIYNGMVNYLKNLNNSSGIEEVKKNETIIKAAHFNNLISQASYKDVKSECTYETCNCDDYTCPCNLQSCTDNYKCDDDCGMFGACEDDFSCNCYTHVPGPDDEQ